MEVRRWEPKVAMISILISVGAVCTPHMSTLTGIAGCRGLQSADPTVERTYIELDYFSQSVTVIINLDDMNTVLMGKIG